MNALDRRCVQGPMSRVQSRYTIRVVVYTDSGLGFNSDWSLGSGNSDLLVPVGDSIEYYALYAFQMVPRTQLSMHCSWYPARAEAPHDCSIIYSNSVV